MTGAVLVLLGYVSSQLKSETVSVDTSQWARFVPATEVATLILGLGIALLLPFLAQCEPSSKVGNLFNGLGANLAAFSYTLYLTHYPALYIWEHYLPERYGRIDAASITWYGLRVLSCVLFAWLCSLPFEKQTGRVRRILRAALTPKARA